MKYSCEVIRDLLPLYHDEVCSPQSRTIVEEHCAECPDCLKILNDYKAIPETKTVAEEIKPLTSIRKKWKKLRMTSLICLCVSLILAITIGGYCLLTMWECVSMDQNELSVVSVCQYADGCVEIRYSSRYICHAGAFGIGNDGNMYIQEFRPILAQKVEHPDDIAYGCGFHLKNGQIIIGNREPITKVYLGVKDCPERSILIWEEGMTLRPATEEEEEHHEDYYDH